MYAGRSNQLERNRELAKRVMDKYRAMFAPVIIRCPLFSAIIAHMFIIRPRLRVQEVKWTLEMKDWQEEDCKRVGRSISIMSSMLEVRIAY